MNRVLYTMLIFLGLFVVACSDQQDDNIEKAIEVGKKYKETVYTVDYADIPKAFANRAAYVRELGKPYLTEDELESSIVKRVLDIGIQIAETQEVNIAVKDITFEYMDLPDNTETKINLKYTITIELYRDEHVKGEYTFNGRMRVEERDEGWRIAWDKEEMPLEALYGGEIK